MGQVKLLRALPRGKRTIADRSNAKTDEHIRASKLFGELYFDGPREYGYGGYRYDGRWVPVVQDIIEHFALQPGDRVLDIGCAKGFLVKDLLAAGLDAFGVDISEYALLNCEPEVVGRLQRGNAKSLPFPDKSFAAVLAINSIHNLPSAECASAIREIERLAPGRGFIQVDSYRTPEQKELFESWVLTAETHGYPEFWIDLFAEAGFTGDYDWTILSLDGSNE